MNASIGSLVPTQGKTTYTACYYDASGQQVAKIGNLTLAESLAADTICGTGEHVKLFPNVSPAFVNQIAREPMPTGRVLFFEVSVRGKDGKPEVIGTFDAENPPSEALTSRLKGATITRRIRQTPYRVRAESNRAPG